MLIIDALKNLTVKMKGSGTAADITTDQIADTIQYIADNWDDIKSSIGTGTQYTLPAASQSAIGGVKQGIAVAEVSAADASASISAEYTQAEVQAIATLANANKAAINDIITSLKTAGVLA